MKKTVTKKLVISKITISNLKAPELVHVVGGRSNRQCITEHPQLCG